MPTFKIVQYESRWTPLQHSIAMMTNIHSEAEGEEIVDLLNNDESVAIGILYKLETENENSLPSDQPSYEKPVLAVVSVTCPLCDSLANRIDLTNTAQCLGCGHIFEDSRL